MNTRAASPRLSRWHLSDLFRHLSATHAAYWRGLDLTIGVVQAVWQSIPYPVLLDDQGVCIRVTLDLGVLLRMEGPEDVWLYTLHQAILAVVAAFDAPRELALVPWQPSTRAPEAPSRPRRIVCDADVVSGAPRLEGTRIMIACFVGRSREQAQREFELALSAEEWRTIQDWLASAAGQEEVARFEAAAWICECGLPMARNPHPDAGKPARLREVGATWVCVPCTVLGRHKAHRDAREALDALEAEREAHAATRAAIDKILPL